MSTHPITGIHHVAIRVHDFEKAIAFYRDGLGFKERVRWNDGKKWIVLLDAGSGDYIEILSHGKEGAQPEGAWGHLALRTTDCDAAIELAVKAGAKILIAPKEMPINPEDENGAKGKQIPVRLAFCQGLFGEVIEFFQNIET